MPQRKRDELSIERDASIKAVTLYSSGKDSNLALYHAFLDGIKENCLLSMIPQSRDSWMFHFPNAKWTALQAEAMEIPIVQVEASRVGETEMKDLEYAISLLNHTYEVEMLISGVIESRYQKDRLTQICQKNDLRLITPLWKKRPERLISELIELGFDTTFVGVSAMGLGEEWLGRRLDNEALLDLEELSDRYGIHLAGEGGEYETFVCDSPLFKRRIEIVRAEREWKQGSGILRIEEADLRDKKVIR